MSCNVVDVETGRKCHSTSDVIAFLQTKVSSQSSNTILNSVCNFRQRLPRFDILLRPLTNLSMNLCSLPVFSEKVIVNTVKVAFFLAGSTKRILIPVFDFFSLRVLAIWE
jgi:hypothetical protein